MLDPLTALGLASNIISLVTFTSDLISKSREYYDSADGALIEQLELEAITISLQKLTGNLVVPTGGRKKTKTEQQLSELCTGCREISKELLVIIQGLKSEGSHTRWNSFRQALKSVWKEDKIKALEARLDRYRRQIDTTLLISLRTSIDDLSKSERESERVSQIVLRPTKNVKQWQAELIDEVHQNDWKPKREKDVMSFSAKLSANAKERKEEADLLIKQHIFERLRFSSMEDRADRIPQAHSKTFDWIFQDSEASDGRLDQVGSGSGSNATASDSLRGIAPEPQWSNFVHWLRGDSSLYWITSISGTYVSTANVIIRGVIASKLKVKSR
jgi:hypothetical protein